MPNRARPGDNGARRPIAAAGSRPRQLDVKPGGHEIADGEQCVLGHGSRRLFSAATITRLTKDWQDEATTFNKRSLAGTDTSAAGVDGIHLKVRLEQDKVCL